MSQMPTYDYSYTPEPPKKNNKTLIIIIIVAVVLLLCCCTAVIGYVGWNYGDEILYELGLSLAPLLPV